MEDMPVIDPKIVFAFHPFTRRYVGPFELAFERGDMDPLEPGRWLIPGSCLEVEPPEPGPGQYVAEEAGAWVLRDIPVEPDPPQPEPPTVEQRIALLLRHVDAHLNAGAALRRYDSIITASLRAGYPGPFHDEGVVYATWMDATYARCYEILAQWEAGEIAEPTAAELLAMLPPLELPA
ncbi:hypothetical protein [Pseudorhodoferax sp. Leaf274]|uniref:hypothetical protein n=1 Tax=Pseudorhodoferax sp. Leaf274 TaxID=1736318 RepID=UPI000703C182|nr:hypothetical protein [Pseudorhodoferax sp. Leaf274]KQP39683.1 hypothetical protein ASF44_08095 [Pseudorhodoferax sp. Leaf274]